VLVLSELHYQNAAVTYPHYLGASRNLRTGVRVWMSDATRERWMKSCDGDATEPDGDNRCGTRATTS
jgi:hypothetical protein